jgi:dolichol-phosphate mannosyltransferase
VASFSIIVPLYNESNNIYKLVTEIYNSLKKYNNFELILVNDGSEDNTKDILEKIKINYPIKIVENKSNLGQSFSIWIGIKYSNHKTIITLDGDGQNNPYDIPKLLKIYFSNKFSLVGGIRKKRKDSLLKIISSKTANKIRSAILKDNCIDTGCSLKVFDKDIFLSFPFFDGLHRFLPALFKGYGMNTFFIEVDHRPRISGISKYGTLDRLYKGIIDIIRVKKIIKTNRLKNKGI